MAQRLKYIVMILDPEKAKSDPKGGHVVGIPRIIEKGRERNLTAMEMKKYLDQRSGYEDLDFNNGAKGVTEYEFQIDAGSKWNFQSTPMAITTNSLPSSPPVIAERKKGNRKHATFKVPNAHGTDRHKYELKYENTSGGDKWLHDPVIKNGDSPPY